MIIVDASEEWRAVIGWEDLYQVSSLGRVRSLDRLSRFIKSGRPITRKLKGKILRQYKHKHRGGYPTVGLHRDGEQITHFVHRLVCEAFHGPRPAGADVAHADGNTANSHADNLRWATRRENMADTIIHGTRAAGERHGNSKLTARNIIEIRSAKNVSQRKLAAQYGVVQSCVANILAGRRWANPAEVAS